MNFDTVSSVDVGQYFKIYAIDDDVVWIDDDVVWIEDGAAWFQINPNELVDPESPDKPLIEGLTLTEEELSLRCWVPRAAVQYTGDLFSLPTVSVPVVTPTLIPTATLKPIIYPTATPYPPTATPFIPTPTPGINCSDYTTYEDCMEHANYGCEWNPNTGVCFQRP